MDLGITGKVALVTGGSRGLGHAAAQALGREGCKVIIIGRDRARLDAAVAGMRAEEIDAHGDCADLTVKAEVKAALARIRDQHGVPDIFVYNSGGSGNMYFAEAEDQDYYDAFNIYVMGFVWCMNDLMEDMKAKGWSRIVQLGSLCAIEPHRAYPMVMHNMGRAAQVGLHKNLSNHVGNTGMTMNVIATGMIDHDGGSIARAYNAHSFSQNMSEEDIRKFRVKDIPLGRMGSREDIADMCAFLCSDRAGFVNGQTIRVDGGRVAFLL